MKRLAIALIFLCTPALGAEYVVNLQNGQHARVAPHFTAKEFACHHCGVRKVSGALLYRLELLRVRLGAPIVISSGYRCQDHNKKVGGAGKSQHMAGRAADIQVKGYTPKQVATVAKAVGFTFVKTYDRHTHVDVR